MYAVVNDDAKNKVHWSFWLIAGITLIWNLMGCINFVVQMNPDSAAAYRETEQAIILGRPLWATAGFAVGVFAGAMGSLLLILKRPTAVYLFIASLLGIVTTTIHTLTIGVNFSAGELVGIVAMPTVVAVFLIWYARYVVSKGWARAT